MLEEGDMDDTEEQHEDERLRERTAAVRRQVAARALAPFALMDDLSPEEKAHHGQFAPPAGGQKENKRNDDHAHKALVVRYDDKETETLPYHDWP